jgi:ABC-type multidrug transport system fused ATPase/permease subunit
VLAENINGVRVVQSFSREDTNYSYFRDVVNQYNLNANLTAARLSSIFFPSVDFLGTLPWRWLSGWAAQPCWATALPRRAGGLCAVHRRFFDPIRDLSMRYDS